MPFGGDKGRVKSYLRNYKVTSAAEVADALSLGVFYTLLEGEHSLSPEEKLALMIWAALGMMVLVTLWSCQFSPRAQRRRLMAQQKQDRLRRPWQVLSYFHGSLFVSGHRRRPEPAKETKLVCSTHTSTHILARTLALAHHTSNRTELVTY